MTHLFKQRRMYFFLLVLVLGAQFGFQGWRTLLNNFAVENGGLSGLDIGIVQSVREIPGFFALLALYVILIIREHRLAALSVAILGLGVGMTGFFPSTLGLGITTLIMSFGFHYFETMNQSLTLQYFSFSEAPIVMGRLRSLSALVNITVGGLIYGMAIYFEYTEIFLMLGCITIVCGLWGLMQDPTEKDKPPQEKKIAVKKRYWLYYVLTFLSGARRQVFVVFAVFLLVEKYQYTIQDITLLFVVNNIVNFFVNPLIGKAVNKYGEHIVLSMEYAALTGVFLGYAFTESALVAGGLYIVDNLFFNFAIGVKTFYQKIADKEDIASGMAVGFTVNHIAAVFIPFLGGVIWIVDSRTVFLIAVGLSLISLILTQCIPIQLRKIRSMS